MFHYYEENKPRAQTYEQMIQRMLECVREGMQTCVALYGHPGVFAWPAHEAIRRARGEGYEARMLPAVSAEDCLFADCGIDPAMTGCQSYEATDFMINGRVIDTSSTVILWQIGVLGDWSFKTGAYDTSSMPLLLERLRLFYPGEPPGHRLRGGGLSRLQADDPSDTAVLAAVVGRHRHVDALHPARPRAGGRPAFRPAAAARSSSGEQRCRRRRSASSSPRATRAQPRLHRALDPGQHAPAGVRDHRGRRWIDR